MNFRQLLAKFVSGNLPSEEFPALGLKGMEEGFDSPSLTILAGLAKNEDSYVLERYFELTIKELEIKLPAKRKAALIYAVAIAEEVVSGKQTLIAGVNKIIWDALDSFDFRSETKKVLFDSIGFESVTKWFYEHDNLTGIHPPLKEHLEEIDNIKIELYQELVKWQQKTAPLLS